MKKSNEHTLKEVLQAMVEAYRLKPRLHQTKIKSIWENAMGASIAKYTSDIKVRNRKLYLNISSAPLRQELSYGREKIKKMINEEIGEEYIEEVVIR